MKLLNVISNYFFFDDVEEVGLEGLWFYIPIATIFISLIILILLNLI